jgi:hypothetical protein
MADDIITRIHIYGVGQQNLAEQTLQAAREEAALYDYGDDPSLAIAIRQDAAQKRERILADALERARPMAERAAEARKDPPAFLYRQDDEARDPTFRRDPHVDRLYRDALRANLVTLEIR